MMSFLFAGAGPGLLVSVRSAAEALEALTGGADVIDVKEPDRGPLGAADSSTIAEVVRAVNGRVPVTAAMGELVELGTDGMEAPSVSIPRGVSLFKIGLAGCRENAKWSSSWQDVIRRVLRDAHSYAAQPVAVVYADWRSANAPEPNQVLNAAVQTHCPAVLVDTWDKSSGSLFHHWPIAELTHFVDRVQANGIELVIAGSLAGASVVEAVDLQPNLIAVRTAACDGGRAGSVSRVRVRALEQLIAARRRVTPSRPTAKEFP
jgi:(5-formylfuran-3-yl)methyl phosphate synthase